MNDINHEEKAPYTPRTPQQSLDRMLPTEEECIRCKKTTHRVNLFHDTSYSEEAVQAVYKCSHCSYQQGYRINGSFVQWYLKHFTNKGNIS